MCREVIGDQRSGSKIRMAGLGRVGTGEENGIAGMSVRTRTGARAATEGYK
jgi:hypothetical protein